MKSNLFVEKGFSFIAPAFRPGIKYKEALALAKFDRLG
jgi:hypothetical protein